MPENKKRPGHPYQKPADVPASQRVKAKILWAILFSVFGFLISYFAVGTDYKILAATTIVAAIIGYIIGKQMEKKK